MIVAIIQARMGSTRLPGKVLMEVNGSSLLEIMLKRVALSNKVDQIIVATSELPQDDPIAKFCVDNGHKLFRGSETDVLSRFYQCATQAGASVIVRLTADCPLIDPTTIEKVIALYENSDVDYASNTVPPETSTFPDGSDVEVFSYDALTRAYYEAQHSHDREHVTFYFWRDPDRGFKTVQLRQAQDQSKYRLTVDYPEDFAAISIILTELVKHNPNASLSDMANFLNQRPDIYELNSKYYFGQGWQK